MTDGSPIHLGRFFAWQVEQLLAGPNGLAAAIEDLTLEELHIRPAEQANSIGFEVWHAARTVDSIVHFTFYREPPVWLQQGLDEAWGLPRVFQGSGMPSAEAHALRFPTPDILGRYCRDVAAICAPRLETMDEAFLAEVVRGWQGMERPRIEMVGSHVIAHGYAHLGKVDVGRAVLGKPGLGL